MREAVEYVGEVDSESSKFHPDSPGAFRFERLDASPEAGSASPAGSGRAYYNEWDRFAAQWLRNLAATGKITDGVVDETSITEVSADVVTGYERAHFFAGIGGWDLALKLAGWPANKPVWTGSCPCQPFSAAGKRAGNMDTRHLWPNFLALIRACKPPTILGEQVASSDGRVWLDGVRADLEALGYEVGAADLCAAGVSAPHIRQRLYWVAHAPSLRRKRMPTPAGCDGQGDGGAEHPRKERGAAFQSTGGRLAVLGMEHAESDGQKQWRPESSQWGITSRRGTDGKWRRIEPGIEPLAHGVPGRVGKLRAYGNAIVPQVAAEFIRAFLEAAQQREPQQESPSKIVPGFIQGQISPTIKMSASTPNAMKIEGANG
jgi:DNA (cytosine-5)-methyltransferase 1